MYQHHNFELSSSHQAEMRRMASEERLARKATAREQTPVLMVTAPWHTTIFHAVARRFGAVAAVLHLSA